MFSTGFRADQRSDISSRGKGSYGHESAHTRSEQGKPKVLEGHTTVQAKKDNRQEAIINVLKSQSNLTIKDFSKVIKDCSEKTIQRELIDLVDRGIVKKEGERRWSRYSLK
jgi:predicted HTH transcriptional regulator